VPVAGSLSGIPNPCSASGSVIFGFFLPEQGHVDLSVFDLAGRRVARILGGEMREGEHTVSYSPDLACGLYLVRLATPGRVELTKLLVND